MLSAVAVQLSDLVQPKHCGLVLQECQRGVIGDLSALPELAAAAQNGMIANCARLAEAARSAGVPVIHCTAVRRADGRGSNHNGRLFQYMARSKNPLLPGSPAAQVVQDIRVDERDIVIERLHGVSPFQGTELDFLLRNLGVSTLIGVGVSVNVAIPNLTFDAVNASYQVVLPRDAVAGFPADYVDAVFQHTLSAIATVTTTDAIIQAWSVPA